MEPFPSLITSTPITPEGKEEEKASSSWSYKDKNVLAPMVRIGTLPMRLLAQKYGCDITYCEEIIDRKIIRCSRRVCPSSGRIEFVLPQGGAAFVTVPHEPVVFQIGTADSVLALKAAQVVAGDVRAIDINMGCPKHFSIQGGMGAALLSKPVVVHDIISTLTRNLSGVPVTCKIRLLEKPDDTVALCKAAESAGVSAIAIHARRIEDRPRNPARIHEVPTVLSQLSVPVIYNGDVFYYDDMARVRTATGATGVMVARGAQWNPSIFRKDGMLPLFDVARDYLTIAQSVSNVFANSKYAIQEMLKMHIGPLPLYQTLCNSRNYEQLTNALVECSKASSALTGPYVAPTAQSLKEELARRAKADAAAAAAAAKRKVAGKSKGKPGGGGTNTGDKSDSAPAAATAADLDSKGESKCAAGDDGDSFLCANGDGDEVEDDGSDAVGAGGADDIGSGDVATGTGGGSTTTPEMSAADAELARKRQRSKRHRARREKASAKKQKKLHAKFITGSAATSASDTASRKKNASFGKDTPSGTSTSSSSSSSCAGSSVGADGSAAHSAGVPSGSGPAAICS